MKERMRGCASERRQSVEPEWLDLIDARDAEAIIACATALDITYEEADEILESNMLSSFDKKVKR